MRDNMTTPHTYCIEFTPQQTEKQQEAGFEVCLAIASLEYPLLILVPANEKILYAKLQSLVDFDLAILLTREEVNPETYDELRNQQSFYLEF